MYLLLACAPQPEVPAPDTGGCDTAADDLGAVDTATEEREVGRDASATVEGTGTFAPWSDATHDLTGDGSADLLVGAWQQPAYLLEGPLAVQEPTTDAVAEWRPELPIDRVAAGDIDGDGAPEIVFVLRDGFDERIAVDHGPFVGGRTFSDAAVSSGEFDTVGAVSAGADLDGDGVGDLVFAGDADVFTALGPVADPVEGADADFRIATPEDADGFSDPITGVVIGDFDGDGRADLAVTSYGGSGSRTFVYAAPADGADPVATFTRGGAAAVPDTDGDGTDDLALVGDRPVVALFRGPLVGALTESDAALRVASGNQYDWQQDLTFGTALVGLPDVTGDGLGDLLLGRGGREGGYAVIEEGCCCLDDVQGGAWLLDGSSGGDVVLDDALLRITGSAPGRRHVGTAVGFVADLGGGGAGFGGAPDLLVQTGDGAGAVFVVPAR